MKELLNQINIPQTLKTISYFLFCAGLVFEITPIKISPISFILGWIGNKMNKDIQNHLNTVEKENDMRRIKDLRSEILAFSRTLKRFDGDNMIDDLTEEDYDRVYECFDEYEDLINKYDIENGKTFRAMTYINEHSVKRGFGTITVSK